MLEELGLAGKAMRISVFSDLPRGVGLGSSAAMAVAIIRALNKRFDLDLSVERNQRNRLGLRAVRARPRQRRR